MNRWISEVRLIFGLRDLKVIFVFSNTFYLDFATVERKTKEPAADVSRTSNGYNYRKTL